MLFTDRFSRRADMFLATATELTAEGSTNILVNQYIPLWGCPRTILLENGLRFCSKFSQAVYQLLGVHMLATSSDHPNCNGGLEWVNHTMAQMLAMLVNDRQDDCDLPLPHFEFDYNYSIQSARQRVWRPTKSTLADPYGPPGRFSTLLASWNTTV